MALTRGWTRATSCLLFFHTSLVWPTKGWVKGGELFLAATVSILRLYHSRLHTQLNQQNNSILILGKRATSCLIHHHATSSPASRVPCHTLPTLYGDSGQIVRNFAVYLFLFQPSASEIAWQVKRSVSFK